MTDCIQAFGDPPTSTPNLTCDGWAIVWSVLGRELLKLLVGAQIMPVTDLADARRGIDDLIPPRTWWRREARQGLREVEEYLSQTST